MDDASRTGGIVISPAHERLYKFDKLCGLAGYGVKWGALVAIAYAAYLCVDSIAGRTTLFEALIEFGLFGPKVSITISWVLTFVATGWAIGERRQRLIKTKELGQRAVSLEKMIDPLRSSSGLLPDGSTHPEDH